MANNIQTITTLHNLLDYDMRKLAVCELQLKNILNGWINIAVSLKLKNVLQKYAGHADAHLKKMETFLANENIAVAILSNSIIKAYLEEAEEKFNRCSDAEVKDACLLACTQQINHYKICAYGTAAAYANILGLEKEAAFFHEAEVNEKQIDDRLSQLAEYEINSQAKSPIVLP